MNRRQFSASLAALAAAPALPVAALSSPATAQALPPATYLWADMIARARGHVDAGFLARRLGLTPAMAQSVMGQLVQNGVVAPPALSGVASAVDPVRFPTTPTHGPSQITRHIKEHVQTFLEDDTPSDDRAVQSDIDEQTAPI